MRGSEIGTYSVNTNQASVSCDSNIKFTMRNRLSDKLLQAIEPFKFGFRLGSSQALAEAISPCDPSLQELIFLVSEITGCPVKPSDHHSAKARWILDHSDQNYEGAKTLLRDLSSRLVGKAGRGQNRSPMAKMGPVTVEQIDAIFDLATPEVRRKWLASRGFK